VGCIVTIVTTGLLSLMTTWWFSPFDAFSNNSLTPSTFDRRDLVPVAYALFAFVLGATAGLLLRRTLPAMVVTLFGFIGLRYAVEDSLRPHYMSPLRLSMPFDPLFPGVSIGTGGFSSSDQMVSQETLSGAGRILSQNNNVGPTSGEVAVSSNGTVTLRGVGICSGKATIPPVQPGRPAQPLNVSANPVHGGQAPAGGHVADLDKIVTACAHRYGLHQIVSYQPMSRYWPFQLYETALFVGLALVLAGFSLWWVQRRMA
jgi:hypothetical protein